MHVSAVIVHYRAPDLLAGAVRALRADCGRAGLECRVVVVDNGSEAGSRPVLEEAADRLVVPGGNLGYAGGLNRGIAEARGDRLLLLNPDVIVLPGCVAALLEALEGGAAVAGPRFFWDSGRRLLLPPPEERTRRAALLERLAPAAPALAALARRRWRRHARQHWLATEPFHSASLSGALLAIRRAAWERAGPFDEGFPLYFEETDWLLRLARAGLRARHVPRAEAVHLYDQSASAEPRSRAWFAESRRRFERRHYGVAWAAALGGSGRLAGPRGGEEPGAAPRDTTAETVPAWDLTVPEGAVRPFWVEVSPTPLGFPAAAERVQGPEDGVLRWRLPDEVWRRLRPGAYRARVVDARGVEGASAPRVKT